MIYEVVEVKAGSERGDRVTKDVHCCPRRHNSRYVMPLSCAWPGDDSMHCARSLLFGVQPGYAVIRW